MVRPLLFLVVACLAFQLPAASGAPLPAGTGAISGRITDAGSGLPVAEVGVLIFDSETRLVTRSTTDANGDYVTGVALAPGIYHARTSDSGGHIGETYDNLICQAFCSPVAGAPITVTADTTTTGVNFALELGHVVTGRVIDADTGAGVPTGHLDFYTTNSSIITQGFTDNTGRYTTRSALPPGTYFARTHKFRGYIRQNFDNLACVPICVAVQGTPIVVPAGAGTVAGIDFALAKGGVIVGTVTDAGGGAALGRVTAQAFDAQGNRAGTTVTDGHGRYELRGLASGSYTVGTHNERGYDDEFYGEQPLVGFCNPTDGSAVAVTASNTTGGVNVALARSSFARATLGDDFGAGAIDRKIWDRNTFVRRIESGTYVSKLTRHGSNGSNTLSVLDADAAQSIAANVRVDQVCNNGARPRARIAGYFYNDGTPGSDRAGEVGATINIQHNGKGLEARFAIWRCLDVGCDQTQYFVSDRTTFGPALLGQTHRLAIDFDGTAFTFGFDAQTHRVDVASFTPTILPSQYFQRTGNRFKGIGTQVAGVSGPHEGGYIAATFDNVQVNGAGYDNFSTGLLDPAKWALEGFGREVDQGRYVSEITRQNSSGGNTMHFLVPDAVSGFAADVRVAEVHNISAGLRARLAGFFYNDGTPGSSQAGEVEASIDIRHIGGQFLVAFFLGRCNDDPCNSSDTFIFDDTILGPAFLGQTHRLSLGLDGTTFTFGFDAQSHSVDVSQFTPSVRPSQYFQRTGNRFKGLGTRVWAIAPGSTDEGRIKATFDNVVATIVPDPDGDGVATASDTCPMVADAGNKDRDGDGAGDACDTFPDDSRASVDSDGDGMGDEWEVRHGLSTNDDLNESYDYDFDGLTNLEEFQNFTDPNNADSDGDNTGDGNEVAGGRNPLVNEPAVLPAILLLLEE